MFGGVTLRSASGERRADAPLAPIRGQREGNIPPAPVTAGTTRRYSLVAGVAFDDVTMAEAVEKIIDRVGAASNNTAAVSAGTPDNASTVTVRPWLVCTGNLDHLTMLARDSAFRAAYDDADLVLADGMPVVWLSRLAARKRDGAAGKAPLRERVAGSDLFWELGRASAEQGLRLFFLGGLPGAAERAAQILQERHPGAIVCGTYCPPFESFDTPEEQQRIIDTVKEARADVLLVGLGAPKQEKWIVANRVALGVPVSIGVGGTFEMAAGMVRRAPHWMRRTGLEWSYRLMQDPARLWNRYICRDLPYLFLLTVRTLRGSTIAAPRTSVGRIASTGEGW